MVTAMSGAGMNQWMLLVRLERIKQGVADRVSEQGVVWLQEAKSTPLFAKAALADVFLI